MRYYINFDKTINQLVPFYIAGRKLILYLQALISPLRAINDSFIAYAKETRIEASMTSQIFKFEWYLNRKFGKYFLHGGWITIRNSVVHGTPLYYENANVPITKNVVIRQEPVYNEGTLVDGEEGDTWTLRRDDENVYNNTVSFVVTTPAINTELISESAYLAMLKNVIDKYRLANKTYQINIER